MSAKPSLDPDALRIVLFGQPDSGKSSLLSALAQIALNEKDASLGGKLLDPANHLVRAAQMPKGQAEVHSYPVNWQPNQGATRPVVFLDCDGKAADSLLGEPARLESSCPVGSVAHEIGDADAVLLALSMRDHASMHERQFHEFANFLQSLKAARSRGAEIGGLPVFLVLTRCDEVSEHLNTHSDWVDFLADQQQQVAGQFRLFLEKEKPILEQIADEEEDLTESSAAKDLLLPAVSESPFGSIDLHVCAVALKSPKLANAEQRDEPYGVGLLFRQAIQEAGNYRQLWDHSVARLWRLVGVMAGVVALLVAGMLFGLFALSESSKANLLQARVEGMQASTKSNLADRLSGRASRLRDRQKRYQDIRDDAQFKRLKPEQQQFIEDRLRELNDYIPYLDKLREQRSIAAERTEEGLMANMERLRTELKLPDEKWADTDAGQLVRLRLETGEILRETVQKVRNWYLDASDQANRLWSFQEYSGRIDFNDWTAKTERLLELKQRPPFRDGDPIKGGGGLITYTNALRFDRVLDARIAWELDQARLQRVLNLCTAVGLATPTKSRPATLVFSREFLLAEARERLLKLKEAYPDYETAFTQRELPEALLPELRQAAQRQYQQLLNPARDRVLRQLKLSGTGTTENLKRWDAVRDWLRSPEDLINWRELARILARLDDPAADDPVQALALFLTTRQFTLEVKTLRVAIPELRGYKPSESRLEVLTSIAERKVAMSFSLSGEPVHDKARRVLIYTYRLSEGQPLIFKPGDSVWVELPLQGGKERLVWSQSRSSLYSFEAFRLAPRLQESRAKSPSEGRVIDDVRLTLQPENGVPQVPELLPEVKFGE
jgi:hypothetical protein